MPHRQPVRATCGSCVHFRGAAAELEAQLPGLGSLGSAFAAVRAADGLCMLRARYLSAEYSCQHFRTAS